MKAIIFITTALVSLNLLAEQSNSVPAQPPTSQVVDNVVIDQAPVVSDPIVVDLVGKRSGVHLYDLNRTRVTIRDGESGAAPEVVLYNSGGHIINTYTTTVEFRERMSLLMSRASEQNPVRVIINRSTLRIERVTPSVDEYSEAPVENQFG